MPKNYYFIFTLAIVAGFFQNANARCSIHIQEDLPENSPVFLTKDHKLWTPVQSYLYLESNHNATIVCSGRNNQINSLRQREAVVKCVENSLEINGQIQNNRTLACARVNEADVINVGKSCVGGGSLKSIGFKTNSVGFVNYIEVCYNDHTASVIYTHHIIPGQAIKDRIKTKFRPMFSAYGSSKSASAISSYKRKTQLLRFTTLLGSKTLAEKYINETSYLSRGHLSPNGDGIFRSWQIATFYYINVAPQWQVVNAKNWNTVEDLARSKANKLGVDLEIYTGVSGVLTLPNVKGEMVPISLKESNDAPLIPAPKWYWKILKYKDEGIAFVTLNNPFAKASETVCEDVCANYQWPTHGFKDLKKGYTYCCRVSELIAKMKGVPVEANVRKTMTY